MTFYAIAAGFRKVEGSLINRACVSDAVAATCAAPLPTQIALQLFRADLPVSTSRASHDDCQQNHRGPDFDDPGVRDDGDLLWPKHPAR